MNSDTILSLISDLYQQAAQLQAENEQLRASLEERHSASGTLPQES